MPPAPPQRGRAVLTVAAVALLVAIVIVALFGWWYESHFVSTDDAFIDTQVLAVSARVPGQVIAVPVTDNQAVSAGDVLVRIDPTPSPRRRRPVWKACSLPCATNGRSLRPW